jgi:hypothetical protein
MALWPLARAGPVLRGLGAVDATPLPRHEVRPERSRSPARGGHAGPQRRGPASGVATNGAVVRPAARIGRSRPSAAGTPESADERHRSDGSGHGPAAGADGCGPPRTTITAQRFGSACPQEVRAYRE